MKQLAKYIKPYWAFICLTMLIKLFGAVLELWIPSLMETMLDEKVPMGDVKQIYLYGGLMLLAAFTGSNGEVKRFKIVDHSFHNWFALALAVCVLLWLTTLFSE